MKMVKLKSIFVVLLLSFWATDADAGSVFLFAPFLSKSVTITFIPLVKELASRGHQVPRQIS
jgi:hypothetical protein